MMIQNSDIVREYNIDRIVYELCSNDDFVNKIVKKKLCGFDIDNVDENGALSVYAILTAEFTSIITLMFLMTPKTVKNWSNEEYENAVYKQFDDSCIERFFSYYPIMANKKVFRAWFGDSIPTTTETMLEYRHDVASLMDLYIESYRDEIDLAKCIDYISEFLLGTRKKRLRHIMLNGGII